ncbi:MAG: DUF1501 domain-containing protein [Myxococcota bacterium]
MSFSRRNFLVGGASLGGLLTLGATVGNPMLASAGDIVVANPDRYFVFVYFFGGWDVILSLDPKDPGEYTQERLRDTGIEPGYETLVDEDLPSGYLIDTAVDGMTFGPYIGRLQRHAEKLCVMRGVAMDSVAHQVGQRHANTGRKPAGVTVRGSSLATWFASILGREETVPNLAVGIESFNVANPAWASGLSTQSIDDLYDALRPGRSGAGAAERDALDRFFAAEHERTKSNFERLSFDNRTYARDLVDQGLADLFNLRLGSAEMLGLRERFGVDSGVTGIAGPSALLAAQALTNGVSRCVTMRGANGLDSHSGDDWTQQHGPRQRAGFDAIAALIEHLQETPYGDGSTWMDHTTIVVQSEFTRTPALNASGGRDHHLSNSALMLGAGIRGGQVIGASSDYKTGAQPIDFATGKVDTSRDTFIHNENMAATLFATLGVEGDPADLRAEPIQAALS